MTPILGNHYLRLPKRSRGSTLPGVMMEDMENTYEGRTVILNGDEAVVHAREDGNYNIVSEVSTLWGADAATIKSMIIVGERLKASEAARLAEERRLAREEECKRTRKEKAGRRSRRSLL